MTRFFSIFETGFVFFQRKQHIDFVVLVLLGGLLFGCTSLNPAGTQLASGQLALAPLNSNPFSKAELNRQDRKIKSDFGGVYKANGLENYLTQISNKLWLSARVQPPKNGVTILDTPSINAFSLPGGRLYVTRGLLALANDEAEIAAILAHEISHVLAQHATARIQREKQTLLVKKVISEVLGDGEVGAVSLASAKASLARFSQQQELEADALGIALAKDAGYDSSGAVRFLKSLKAMIHAESRSFNVNGRRDQGFFGSHPPTQERIDAAVTRLETMPKGGNSDRLAYLSNIDGLAYGFNADDGIIRRNSFLHKKLGIGFSVPADFQLKNTEEAVFASGPSDRVIRFDLDKLPKSWTLSEYMTGSWIKNGIVSGFQEYQVGKTRRATALAEVKGWTFHMGAILEGKTLYRFVLAEKAAKTDRARKILQQTVRNFRLLSAAERRALKGQKIIIRRRNGETSIGNLSDGMLVPNDPKSIFKVINGLDSGRRLSELDFVKYIGQ